MILYVRKNPEEKGVHKDSTTKGDSTLHTLLDGPCVLDRVELDRDVFSINRGRLSVGLLERMKLDEEM